MITIIESQANAKIKTLKKLQLKKYRQQFGQFVVENFKIIHDAADSGHLPEAVFISHEWISQYPQDLDFLQTLNVPLYTITAPINAHFSSLETPSGIAGLYAIKQGKMALDRSVLYLDHVMDPGNLGTLMRCGCAFGFGSVVIAGGVDPYNHKTVSAAKDAIFKISICLDEKEKIFNSLLKAMPVIGAAIGGDADMNSLRQSPVCVVLGSEAHGISPHLEQQLTQKIKISMSNEMESLNVASAGAIMMHEHYRAQVGN